MVSPITITYMYVHVQYLTPLQFHMCTVHVTTCTFYHCQSPLLFHLAIHVVKHCFFETIQHMRHNNCIVCLSIVIQLWFYYLSLSAQLTVSGSVLCNLFFSVVCPPVIHPLTIPLSKTHLTPSLSFVFDFYFCPSNWQMPIFK